MMYHYIYSEQIEYIPIALYLKREKNVLDIATKIKNSADTLLKIENLPLSFKTAFRNGDYYSWPGIRYFLYQYEYHLKSKVKSDRIKLSWEEFSQHENDKDFSTIEHIYPQTSTGKYWTDIMKGIKTKQKKQLKNAPGNLVPLSHAKNASLSNKPFNEKKKDYKNGCYSEIAITENENWGKSEILNRSVELMVFLDTTWELGLCPQAFLKDPNKKREFYLSFLNLNF